MCTDKVANIRCVQGPCLYGTRTVTLPWALHGKRAITFARDRARSAEIHVGLPVLPSETLRFNVAKTLGKLLPLVDAT